MARIAMASWVGLVAALAVSFASCNRNQAQGPDPASVNMAPADESGQQPPSQAAQYPSYAQPAAAQAGYDPQPQDPQPEYAEQVAPQPPPPLPDYSQPPCPGDNYIWTPGYWAYSPQGYYWVPGAWVMAPWVGALWTPPWWGYAGGHYMWHAGYWGPFVGFYGGIDYGFGYTGAGFEGGYWRDGQFAYNRAVLNVRPGVVHEVYDRRPANYTPFNHVSFNGPRGVNIQPNASQNAAFRQRRMGALPAQTQLARQSAGNHAQFAAENRGRPPVVAEARPIAGRDAGAAAPFSAGSAPSVNARPETRAPMPAQQQRAEQPPNQPRMQMPSNNERPRVPELSQRPVPGERPEARPAAPAAKVPQFGQAPTGRPEPHAPLQPMPEAPRPAPRQARPVPEARPAVPAARAPQVGQPAARRPEAQPAPHATQQAPRPAPEARPQMEQHQPHPEAHAGPPGKEHDR